MNTRLLIIFIGTLITFTGPAQGMDQAGNGKVWRALVAGVSAGTVAVARLFGRRHSEHLPRPLVEPATQTSERAGLSPLMVTARMALKNPQQRFKFCYSAARLIEDGANPAEEFRGYTITGRFFSNQVNILVHCKWLLAYPLLASGAWKGVTLPDMDDMSASGLRAVYVLDPTKRQIDHESLNGIKPTFRPAQASLKAMAAASAMRHGLQVAAPAVPDEMETYYRELGWLGEYWE